MFQLTPEAIKQAGEVLQQQCHGQAHHNGWWTDMATGLDLRSTRYPLVSPTKNVGELLCLVHSEVSEAMEGHRKLLMDDKLPHRTMLEVELADAVIRIFDISGGLGLHIYAGEDLPISDDGNAAQRKQPDIAAILNGITSSISLDILRSNYEAAMQMLDASHHPAIKKAANARKAELTAKEEA